MDKALQDLRQYLTMLGQIGNPDPDEVETLEILRRVQSACWLLDKIERAAVRKARLEGASWADIGSALSVSRQAAHEKHGDPTTGA